MGLSIILVSVLCVWNWILQMIGGLATNQIWNCCPNLTNLNCVIFVIVFCCWHFGMKLMSLMTGTVRELKNRRGVIAQGTVAIMFQLTFVMATADLLHSNIKVNSVLILFCLLRLGIRGIFVITDLISSAFLLILNFENSIFFCNKSILDLFNYIG